jgi:hypothetical protein
MIVARFIGRVPVMIGAALFTILGIVLIVLGASASSGGGGKIAFGVAVIVVSVLLFLDALFTPEPSR